MPSMIWWTQKFDFIQRHMDGWILTHSENMVKSCSSNCALHGWFTSQNLYIKTAIYEKKNAIYFEFNNPQHGCDKALVMMMMMQIQSCIPFHQEY